MLAFANFGTALRSTGAESSKSKGTGSSNAVLDYSKQELSLSCEARDQVCFCLLHGTKGAVFKLGCKIKIKCRGGCRLWDPDPDVNTCMANIHFAACCSAESVLLLHQSAMPSLCAFDAWAMSHAIQMLDKSQSK